MAELPEVKIQLVAGGVNEVLKAFRSIEEASQRLETKLTEHQVRNSQKRVSTTAREEKQKTSTIESEAKRRNAAQERAYASLQRDVDRWHRQEIAAEKAKNRQIENEARRHSNARSSFFKQVANDAVSTARNTVGRVMQFAGAALAIGGGFSIADSLGAQMRAEGKAKEISLNSQGEVSKATVLHASKLLGAKGFSAEESLNAIDAFVAKTGDVARGLEVISELADLSLSSSADFTSLSRTAGMAYNAMTPEERANKKLLMEIMRQQAAQARVAALDPKDTQNNWGRVFASSAQFKGGVSENAGFLGALAQMSSIGGTSTDAAEATESAKSLALDIETHKKQLAKLGITDLTYGPKNQLKDVKTVFEKLMVGTGGELSKLDEGGIGFRSLRIFQGPSKYYKQAYVDAKKEGMSDKDAEQAGLKAAMKMIDSIYSAQISAEQVKKESSERLKEVDKQLAIAMEDLKVQVGEKVLPEFAKLIPKLVQLTPYLIKFLEGMIKLANWMAENPWAAAIAAAAALMLSSIGSAFAAAAISALIGGALAGLAALLAPILAVILTAAMTKALDDMNTAEMRKKSIGNAAQNELKYREERNRLNGLIYDPNTPAQMAKAAQEDLELLERAHKESIDKAKQVKEPGMLENYERAQYGAREVLFGGIIDAINKNLGTKFDRSGNISNYDAEKSTTQYFNDSYKEAADAMAKVIASQERSAEALKAAAGDLSSAADKLKPARTNGQPLGDGNH